MAHGQDFYALHARFFREKTAPQAKFLKEKCVAGKIFLAES